MSHRRQRRRPHRAPVRGRVRARVRLPHQGHVVAADDVQAAEGEGLDARAAREDALAAVRQHKIRRLVEPAQRADDDAAVVADDGDDG